MALHRKKQLMLRERGGPIEREPDLSAYRGSKRISVVRNSRRRAKRTKAKKTKFTLALVVVSGLDEENDGVELDCAPLPRLHESVQGGRPWVRALTQPPGRTLRP